jgi:hypothetical protein
MIVILWGQTMEQSKRMLDNHSDIPVVAKLAVGGAGIGVGLIDHIVHWAQIVSILGGAVIVLVTLAGMAYKAFRKIWK